MSETGNTTVRGGAKPALAFGASAASGVERGSTAAPLTLFGTLVVTLVVTLGVVMVGLELANAMLALMAGVLIPVALPVPVGLRMGGEEVTA